LAGSVAVARQNSAAWDGAARFAGGTKLVRLTPSGTLPARTMVVNRLLVEISKRYVSAPAGPLFGALLTVKIGHPAVHYLHQSLPREELTAFYLAADVMLVTPLRDGMNLVAKEYIACRHDDAGVLVLSEFTGAARELTSALLVNPHDTDGVKAAVSRALEMPPDEARRRMKTLRRHVKRHDVNKWARDFLDALGLPS